MAWGRKDKPVAVAQAPAPIAFVIPPEHVKIVRPPDATEEQLRNGYAGQIVKGNSHCLSCWGDEYVLIEGVVRYCDCKKADLMMIRHSAESIETAS